MPDADEDSAAKLLREVEDRIVVEPHRLPLLPAIDAKDVSVT
jgi:hypothetical protein